MAKILIVAFTLTHLSLTSLLWDICKQNSPRCDAAERGVPSWAILFAKIIFIKKLKKIKKSLLESGLTQMMTMGKSIRQIRVNTHRPIGNSSQLYMHSVYDFTVVKFN